MLPVEKIVRDLHAATAGDNMTAILQQQLGVYNPVAYMRRRRAIAPISSRPVSISAH